jgi:beta-lactamase regulating signal transducer with metallopeptidase domain
MKFPYDIDERIHDQYGQSGLATLEALTVEDLRRALAAETGRIMIKRLKTMKRASRRSRQIMSRPSTEHD